jgi:uncharacterized protein (TIGR02145 family)
MEKYRKLKNNNFVIVELWKIRLSVVILAFICLTGCNSNSVKDIDGNYYRTAKIGNQIWMAENLKTTKLSDGTSIPVVPDYDTWSKLNTPAMSWYNNDSTLKNINGGLYNWQVVDTRKLCPAGWHVPTYRDWFILRMYIKVPELAGGTLKETGTAHWRSPNKGATNSTGFTAIGSGMRSFNGSFNYNRISGLWWSSTLSGNNAYYSILNYKSTAITVEPGSKLNGFSIRCIKDQ